MRQSIKGALLSGLVLPGLGQLVLKRPARGLAFLTVSCACIAFLVHEVVRIVGRILADLENLDAVAIDTLAASAGKETGPVGWILLLCWLIAVLDAWRLGDQLDRALNQESRNSSNR